MLTAKLICTLLLPALVLVPATPVGNATLENFASQNGVALNHGQSKNIPTDLRTVTQPVSAEEAGISCKFCGTTEWQPIHTCVNGLSADCFRSNFEDSVVKSADNVPLGNREEQNRSAGYLANRWAIGNVTGREIVERIIRTNSVEWLPVPLAPIPI